VRRTLPSSQRCSALAVFQLPLCRFQLLQLMAAAAAAAAASPPAPHAGGVPDPSNKSDSSARSVYRRNPPHVSFIHSIHPAAAAAVRPRSRSPCRDLQDMVGQYKLSVSARPSVVEQPGPACSRYIVQSLHFLGSRATATSPPLCLRRRFRR
jgi:hypothetical protein